MSDKDKDQKETGGKHSGDQAPGQREGPANPANSEQKQETAEQGAESTPGKPDEGAKADREKPGKAEKSEAPTAIQSQAASQPAKPAKGKKASSTPPRKRGGRGGRLLIGLVLVLVVAALAAAAVVLVERELKARETQREQMSEQIAALQQQLTAAERQVEDVSRQQNQVSREQSRREEQLAQRLADLEEQVSYQSDRLRALSTTTREDWLLAEAEYLLKLADQRMVIERSTEAAQALLEQADAILRDLEDPELRPLRRAITRDLSELKLAPQVDLEGLYLRLSALAEKVGDLPAMPRREVPAPERDSTQTPVEAESGPWWRQVWRDFGALFEGLDEYIRIRDHSEQSAAILPPNAEHYLEQNLRLMLEKAQLAAMRAENVVYRESLQGAIQWARRFYPESEELDNFIGELRRLADLSVDQDLPDISQSRQMLTRYIDRLHKLEGTGQEGGETEAQQ